MIIWARNEWDGFIHYYQYVADLGDGVKILFSYDGEIDQFSITQINNLKYDKIIEN